MEFRRTWKQLEVTFGGFKVFGFSRLGTFAGSGGMGMRLCLVSADSGLLIGRGQGVGGACFSFGCGFWFYVLR